jgi:hypothetical protein
VKKNEKYLIQCADCDIKYKKTIKWLENTHQFNCICGSILDVDELLVDIYTKKKKDVYKVYQR